MAALTVVCLVLVGAGILLSLLFAAPDPALIKIIPIVDHGRRLAWNPTRDQLLLSTKHESLFDSSGSALELYDLDSVEIERRLASSTMKGLAFQQVVFSPDGQLAAATVGTPFANATTSMLGAVVKIWDANSGALKQTFGSFCRFDCVAFSSDGKRLAAGDYSKQQISIWNVETGAPERTLSTTGFCPRRLAFSPSDGMLAVGGHLDKPGASLRSQPIGTVQCWDTGNWQLTRTLNDCHGEVVAFAADGQLLTNDAKGDLLLWNPQTWELTRRFAGAATGCVALSHDGSKIASAGRSCLIRIWDVASGQVIGSFRGHTSQVYSLAFSGDARRLASTSQDKTVRLWKVPEPDDRKK